MAQENKYAAFFSKMKEAFKELTQTEVKFGTAILPDGNTLKWEGDEPMVNSPIMVVNPENGEEIPVADGEYTLEDGRVIVAVGGVITEIKEAEAAAEPEVETDMNDNASTQSTVAAPKEVIERVEKVQKFAEEEINALKENFKNLVEELSATKQENEDIKKENVSLRNQFSAFSKVVTEAINELGNEPQKPVKKEQNFRTEKTQADLIAEERAKIFGKK